MRPEVWSRQQSIDHAVSSESQLTDQVNDVGIRVFDADHRFQESLLQNCDFSLQFRYVKPFSTS